MQKKSITLLVFIILNIFVCLQSSWAQQINRFSISQAVSYAMANAIEVQNALLDINIQKQTNREVTALALPQVNASVSTNHFLDVPVTTLPNFISPSV